MLQGPVEVQISGPLIVVWILPAIAALLVLAATRTSPPHTQGRVLGVLRVLLLGYFVGIVLLTFWPLEFKVAMRGIEEGNWTPFGGSLGFMISDNQLQNEIGGRDVLANVALFFPLGLILPFSFYQWRGVLLSGFIIVVLASALEYFQGLTIAERTFDIDDPIAGFFGGLIGLILAALLRPVASRYT